MMAAVMMLPFMVVVASGLGILLQLPFSKSLGCLIRIPLNAGIDLDACLGQGYLSSAANAAADQSLHLRKTARALWPAPPASTTLPLSAWPFST